MRSVNVPFELERFLPYRLSRATNLVSEVVAQAYERRHGLSVAEWRVLAVLGEGDPAHQQEIGKKTRMDKMTVSRAVGTLVTRKLVARTAHPSDGRAHLLSLTKAGNSVYDDIVPRVREREARVFEALGAKELSKLTDMLSRIEAASLTLLEG